MNWTVSENAMVLLAVWRATYLWVEEIQNGEEAGVDNGKEQISSPTNVGNHDGSDHDNEKVKEPV